MCQGHFPCLSELCTEQFSPSPITVRPALVPKSRLKSSLAMRKSKIKCVGASYGAPERLHSRAPTTVYRVCLLPRISFCRSRLSDQGKRRDNTHPLLPPTNSPNSVETEMQSYSSSEVYFRYRVIMLTLIHGTTVMGRLSAREKVVFPCPFGSPGDLYHLFDTGREK